MFKWNIRMRGIDWGPAYEEAKPICLFNDKDLIVEAHMKEDYSIRIKLPANAVMKVEDGCMVIDIPRG